MKQRIEFIDLAKGVCISLVVLLHCGILESHALRILRMPLYFVLSGIFFKEYGGMIGFTVKKMNKLLIPFFVVTIPVFIIRKLFYNDVDFGFFYYWTGHNKISSSMWFLFVLFQSSVMYALLHYLFKHRVVLLVAVLAVGMIGYITIHSIVIEGFLINKALVVVPLIYIGHQLKSYGILYPSKWDRYVAVGAALVFTVLAIFAERFDLYLDIIDNKFVGNPILLFFVTLGIVVSFMLVCKSIKRVPGLSYIGRYSIVVLCVHGSFIELLNNETVVSLLYLSELSVLMRGIITFVITMGLSALCIPLCINKLPYFFAQKDVLLFDNGKVGFAKLKS